jgi:hypothetical protein
MTTNRFLKRLRKLNRGWVMKLITERKIKKIRKINESIKKLEAKRNFIISEFVGDGKQFLRFADFDHFVIFKDPKYITG